MENINEIKVVVNFSAHITYVLGTDLTVGDYNSTKLKFEFDKPDGVKIMEMKNPSGQIVLLTEIQNDEIILTRYDDEDNPSSIFNEEGIYLFEISLYGNDSKLSSASGKLKVEKGQVIVDDVIAEEYLPVFDELINDVQDALTQVDNVNIDANKSGSVTTVEVTKKDGTTKIVEINDGENGEDGIDGQDGADGFSPIAVTNQTDEGALITITDKTGTTTALAHNGANGKDGADGKDGKDGKDGEDGSDYVITQADYEAIANVVESELSIPSKTSQLQNDSGFITNTVNNLTNYYLSSNTYTKTEVNELIGQISGLKIEVVQTLPVSDIKTDTIYLLPKQTAGTNNVYDEYLYINNSWELIGDTEIDLSGYQTKIDSTHKLSSDLVDDTGNTNLFVTSSEKTAWNGKQDALTAGTNITISSNTISAVDTTYSDATTSASGLMSSTDKTKLNGIATGANVNVQANWNETDTSSDSYIQNKPTIPTDTSDLTNGAGYTTNIGTITSVKMNGSTVSSSGEADLGTVITSHQDISGKENTSNKVTSISSSSTDTQYPSAKCVYDIIGDVESLLSEV